jgi:hypothetical protein
MQRAVRLSLLTAAALALGGCAAAALPALAGGAMVRSGGSNTKQEATIPTATSQIEPQLAESSAQPASPSPSAGTIGAYSRFTSFARNRAFSAKIDFETPSAILRNPGMLDGERSHCGDLPPAILIDLDSEEEAFSPHDAYSVPPTLASELDELRQDDIAIAWISTANMDQYGTIRYALSKSGLDPDGGDHLLLIQHPDERKQTRRDIFAKSQCIVAIAGDSMADFDELFLFLTNPDAAKSLNAIVGDGWFITPLALTKQ